MEMVLATRFFHSPSLRLNWCMKCQCDELLAVIQNIQNGNSHAIIDSYVRHCMRCSAHAKLQSYFISFAFSAVYLIVRYRFWHSAAQRGLCVKFRFAYLVFVEYVWNAYLRFQRKEKTIRNGISVAIPYVVINGMTVMRYAPHRLSMSINRSKRLN